MILTSIILAAGLGTASHIAYALLFRRLRRNLDRQLSDMRAEHNSEWILRALRDVQEGDGDYAAYAANEVHRWNYSRQPARRKGHLGLYLGGGGGLAAMLSAFREAAGHAWQTHRAQLVGAAVGVTAASTAATAVLTSLPNAPGTLPPSTAPPTPAAATITSTPVDVLHATHAPSRGPTAPPTGSRTDDTPTPVPAAPIRHTVTLPPAPGQTGLAIVPPAGSASPTVSAEAPTPAVSPNGVTFVARSPRCIALVVDPALHAQACLQERG
ncbi:hypothetical protein ACWDA7_23875 [Streptomyces sp. NPDC001156]